MKLDKETFNYLNPEDYGLSKRQKLIKISDKEVGLVKMRKSRIIMKDGEQIVKTANTIKSTQKNIQVSLIISGPICSKTVKYLVSNNIKVLSGA